MNEADALAYAEDKGIEDGGNREWSPPFINLYDEELTRVYQASWWAGFVQQVIEEEFPNE